MSLTGRNVLFPIYVALLTNYIVGKAISMFFLSFMLLKKELDTANENLINANEELAIANARIKELEAIIADKTSK